MAWLVTGCGFVGSSPEGRARDFIETLVTAPDNADRLRALAGLPAERPPDALMADLAGRVGVDYLRAMQSRDVPLKFVAGESRAPGKDRRTVLVHASFPQPGTPAIGEVRFAVEFEKADNNRWRIIQVLGDN